MDEVLNKFGVGAILERSARTVKMKNFITNADKGRPTKCYQLTVPKDIVHEEIDVTGVYQCARDNNGNFIFKRV